MMKKLEFLSQLQLELKRRVPRPETEKALLYYSELIDDGVEQGISEEEAVRRLPLPSQIAMSIADGMNSVEATELSDSDMPKIISKIFDGDDEIKTKSPEGKSKVAKSTEGRECPHKQHERKTISDSWEGCFRRKQATAFGTVMKYVGLFFFCIIAVPVFVGLLAAALGCLAGFWATATSLVVVGVFLPLYGIAMGIMSATLAVGFSLAAAGFLLLPIGLIAIKPLCKLSKWFVYAVMAVGKRFFSAFRA